MAQGKYGKVMVGANTVASLTTWTVDVEMDTIDDNYFGSHWKDNLDGLVGWTGSFEGKWAISSDTNGQKLFFTNMVAGTKFTIKLYVNSTDYYEGQILITSNNIEVDVEDKATISYDFVGCGALTLNP